MPMVLSLSWGTPYSSTHSFLIHFLTMVWPQLNHRMQTALTKATKTPLIFTLSEPDHPLSYQTIYFGI